MEQQDQVQHNETPRSVGTDDTFFVIKGTVYNATNFLNPHSIEAERNASQALDLIRSCDVLGKLPPGTRLGLVDLPAETLRAANNGEQSAQQPPPLVPPVERMILLRDFEYWAEKVIIPAAWSYYHSAAGEERSQTENPEALRRYFFRPRMLRDMSKGSINTLFMGITSRLPIYIAPAAMAKLGHPLGEVNLTKAAGHYGIVQSVSTNANCSLEEIFEAKVESQALFYQIYIDEVRDMTAELIKKVERLGVKAIIFTIDVGWTSKRTLELRTDEPIPEGYRGSFMAAGRLQDRNLSWDDISWIRQLTTLPIIIKGAQCLEDIELCVKYGAEGVMISNHGGRQLDYAPATIDILYELRTYRADIFDKIDVMIDGGVRSGADVVKLLALGAKAVGFGQTFLYANATHGEEGVKRVIEILREEIFNTMWNLGAASICDLKPEMVGPSGPWVGSNRPSYTPRVAEDAVI